MRRKDRQNSDSDYIFDILNRCDAICVAFAGQPYVVPLNFGIQYKEGDFTLYFHGADCGTKMDRVKSDGQVAFAAFCHTRFVRNDVACLATMEYESVCGSGIMEVCSGPEKRFAMEHIMRHYGERDCAFESGALDAVSVMKLSVQNISGKSRK